MRAYPQDSDPPVIHQVRALLFIWSVADCVRASFGLVAFNGSLCAKAACVKPRVSASQALAVLVQAHLKVSSHLVVHNALHSVEELSLVYGACCVHHLLLAAVH